MKKDAENGQKKNDIIINFYQSNYEGQLVAWIQEAIEASSGLIINPAAYSHTSVALLDALKMFSGPKVEVHLSHIYQREAFRHHSYTSAGVDAIITGCGGDGYRFALEYIAKQLSKTIKL